jgi:hypothetical protein
MKTNHTVFMAIVLAFSNIFAADYFLVKANGDTVWGDSKIKFGFASSRVFVGNDTISGDSIEYICSSKDTLARTPDGGFADLQKHGQRIDLFSTDRFGSSGFPTAKRYYRIDNSKLKLIDYENVKSDFSEFENSRKMIEYYEFAERWDHWLMIGGIAIFASGLAIEPNPDKAGVPVKTVLSAGSLSFIFGAGFWLTKRNYIDKAFELYFSK